MGKFVWLTRSDCWLRSSVCICLRLYIDIYADIDEKERDFRFSLALFLLLLFGSDKRRERKDFRFDPNLYWLASHSFLHSCLLVLFRFFLLLSSTSWAMAAILVHFNIYTMCSSKRPDGQSRLHRSCWLWSARARAFASIYKIDINKSVNQCVRGFVSISRFLVSKSKVVNYYYDHDYVVVVAVAALYYLLHSSFSIVNCLCNVLATLASWLDR